MIQIGNRMVWTPAICSLVILMIFSFSCVSASPQLPCEFYGPVFISGTPAPAGTVITAYVNSVQQGKITVNEAGKYGSTGTFDERLIVLAGENDFTGGAPTITFKIGDKVADQTARYEPGMSKELSMSSGGGAPSSASSVSPVSAASVSAASVPAAQAAAAAPVTNASPVAVAPPVVQAPVVPVVTSSVPAVTVPAQNVTKVPTINQTVSVPVVPVVTAAPVPVVAAVSVPPANQTPGNVTNATAIVPVNASPVVSFPSGQTITK